ncbi:MAG: peptide deformylase [Planctomycetota bacterium]|nr:MAG: peptide deformylase [Planctomycetota bacterium]
MKILHYPHPLLLRRTQEVDEIGDQLLENVRRMLSVMYRGKGIGLAGNQAGLDMRLFVANLSEDPKGEIVMINPEIVARGEGRQTGDEGCLSFPHIYGKVTRHSGVEVEYYDLDGKLCRMEAEGLLARVIQHEIDHLDGIVFISKMSPGDRTINARRIKKMESDFLRNKK